MTLPAKGRRFLRDVYDGQWLLRRMNRITRQHLSRPDLLLEEVAHELLTWLHSRQVAVFLRAEPWPSLQPEDGRNAPRLQVALQDREIAFLRYLRRPSSPHPVAAEPVARYRGPELLADGAPLSRMLARAEEGAPEPLEIPGGDDVDDPADSPFSGALSQESAPPSGTGSRLLAPLVAGDQVLGFLALGPKRSDEPFFQVDRELLTTVAGQVASALDHSRLLHQRIDQEKLQGELEIARQVQEKLFPPEALRLPGLEVSGKCLQAREVGGDYYDFIAPEPGKLGIALGDISGKGISAALLMASLQAHLRSHYSVGGDDLLGVLRSVNRQFCRSIASSRFATLFFGHYDDAPRRLRYVNCGHVPPILLRADGEAERLGPTATVVGAFPEWDGSVGEIRLEPGDTLVVFSDGIVEATNEKGEEFGDAGLLEVLQAHRHRTASALRCAVLAAVRKFSGPDQADDMTLLLARARQHRTRT